MQRELCIKCKKCNKVIKFDYYAKKFICYECNIRMGLDEINDKNKVIQVDNDFDKEIKNPKVLVMNYTKEDFIKKIKRELQYKILAPKEFIKIKKYKSENINLIYLPLLVYETKCAYYNNKQNIVESYEINNMIFDDYANFDKETLNSLYPVNINEQEEREVSEEVIKNFNLDNILDSIHKKAKRALINTINKDINTENDIEVIFLKEKLECLLLPIYDCNKKYQDEDYHLSMNANTGKVSIKVPLDNKKLCLIIIFFLVIDIILFEIGHLLRILEVFLWSCSIFLFIIQVLLILFMYFSTNSYEDNINNKNKYEIKIINK